MSRSNEHLPVMQEFSELVADTIESAAMRVDCWVPSVRVTVTVEQLRQWAVRAQEQPEIGWLIEMLEPDNNKAPCPRWWHPETGWTWDSNNAIRFAREKDAADYLARSHCPGKPTKHSWHALPLSTPARPVDLEPEEVEARAREILLTEYEAEGVLCGLLKDVHGELASSKDRAALRAIIRALGQTP